VTNVNDPPTNPSIDTGEVEFKENETQTVTASAMDIDPDETLSYEWSVEGIGTIGTGTSIDLDLPAGNYTLILKVTDSSGSYTTTSIDIEVLPVDSYVPHTEDDPKGMSFLPFIIGISLFLVIIAFALSVFFIRNRNQRSEYRKDGINAWNRTMYFENGPTPQEGMTQGPGTAPNLHRLDPTLGPAPTEVNGGRLGELSVDSNRAPEHRSEQETGYLSDLMEEVLTSKTGPTTKDLSSRLESAKQRGDLPEKEYREIIRRLNNIDKYRKI
jgi:hypothetical protein